MEDRLKSKLNLVNTALRAVEMLEKEPTVTNDAEPIDQQWLHAFKARAGQSNESSIQERWARILTSKVQGNACSLAALHTMEKIDRRVADLFAEYCLHRIHDIIVTPQKDVGQYYIERLANFSLLESVGLTKPFVQMGMQRTPTILKVGDKEVGYCEALSPSLAIISSAAFVIQGIHLTYAGGEIANALQLRVEEFDIADSIAASIKGDGYIGIHSLVGQ